MTSHLRFTLMMDSFVRSSRNHLGKNIFSFFASFRILSDLRLSPMDRPARSCSERSFYSCRRYSGGCKTAAAWQMMIFLLSTTATYVETIKSLSQFQACVQRLKCAGWKWWKWISTIFFPSYIDEKDRLGWMTFFIMSKIALSLSSLCGLYITPSKLS